MSGLFAIVIFEAGGKLLVFRRHLSPLFVPAFEIEKLYPARHAADIGIGMIRRRFHTHFQLTAAAKPFRRVKKFLGLFSVEYVAARLIRHD